MSDPLISVIITSYNYLHFITQAIDSALGQTYPNVEVVISDNCSTDGTVPALRARYGYDPRVRIFENERNLGETANVNIGYGRTTGSFVCWLSADDWMFPEHLERLHDVFRRAPAIDVAYCDAYFATVDGRIYEQRLHSGALPFAYVDARDELVEMLTSVCPMCYPSMLFRRSVFEDVGLEDPDGGIVGTDWEMQVRMALAGKKFAYLPSASIAIRVHPQQQSTGQPYLASPQRVVDALQILDKFAGHPAMDRLRGREGAIARLVTLLAASLTEIGGEAAITPELRARIAATTNRLEARAQHYEPARVRSSLVSVIVPAVRSPRLAVRALRSLVAQRHEGWEAVLLDACPTRLGDIVAAEIGDARITCIRLPTRLSPGAARNLGMRLARGEYLAFLAEDNTYAPDHLAALVATIERTGARAAAATAQLVTELSDPRFCDIHELGTYPVFRNAADPPARSLVADALPLDAVLAYRQFQDLGVRFNEAAPILDDYDFLLGLEARWPLAFAPDVTVDVRARLDFSTNLGAHLPIYAATLEAVHAAHPAPALAAERARHRAAVSDAIAGIIGGGAVTRERATALLAALAGAALDRV